MAVEIVAFRRVDKPESQVVAEIDVFLPKMHLTLRRCRMIRTKAGGFFVGFPSFKTETDEWAHYYEFAGNLSKTLQVEILEASQHLLNQDDHKQEIPDAPAEGLPF